MNNPQEKKDHSALNTVPFFIDKQVISSLCTKVEMGDDSQCSSRKAADIITNSQGNRVFKTS